MVQNQDAYLIGHGAASHAALCDGAGNAQAVAKRALALLDGCVKDATLGQLLKAETWERWARTLDSALLGGPETTLAAVAVLGREVVGLVVGDSRVYLIPAEGPARLLSEQTSKTRLGSGEIEPYSLRAQLQPRDVLRLLSDGAWGPLGLPGIERAARSAALGHFSEVPSAVFDAASRRGRGDDMTVVALRVAAL
jgi:serine/threonine protein phosphatase PrpC